MQSVSSRIWTRVAVSISYDDNHYTTGTSKSCLLYVYILTFVQLFLKVFWRHKISIRSLFNGISTLFRLFNAKAILLEEQ